MVYFAVYLMIVNLAAYGVCGYDKFRAVRQKRRVPERTLWMLAALGGPYGLLAGMYAFRHKTRHRAFRYLTPVLCVLWLAVIAAAVLLFAYKL